MSDVVELESRAAPELYWDFDDLVVFDALEGARNYVLSGKNGSQIKLSASAGYLLQATHSGMSFAELAQKLNERNREKHISEQQLRDKYQVLLKDLSAIEAQDVKKQLPWGFWLRCRLVPERLVTRITSFTASLYHPAAMVCCVAIMLAAVVFALYRGFPVTFHSASIGPAYLLFALVLLVHECGHASACARYGARPSDIGFLIYLIYPAFYSDVSSAWRLSRFQRVMVDLGGCYFQGIVSAGLLFASYWINWEPLRIAVLLSLYSALFSLNPIFKFDGYWVLADSLGVSNLSRQPSRIGKYLLARIRRRPAGALPWPSWVIAVLMAYSGLVIVVWTYFIFRLFPMLLLLARAISHTGAGIIRNLLTGKLPLWHDVGSILYTSALLLFITVTLWNIIKWPARPVFAWLKRLMQHSADERTGQMPQLNGATTEYPGQLEHQAHSGSTRPKTEAVR